ncbi:MAG: ArsR family transcriptional regulator [Halanaerobium sp. 4-GBenrich]|jgi:DNA-binding transcriptional ArsR family regulator|uniref:ArsR family transcriptional regulator n=2 Tax=Halanaerobium congolense TaxID=54121 RepID=A0A1M7IHH3_9FIRM|nr:MAG: ArsR family transcriptional regulator [Halanaerobium sp. 4-GBenrich]PXV65407.1 ArsR family transcriptional regulator [Halanaerobium congolense]SDH48516.1 DNA-binding transcriptional regulator, ArsR family [Halanaerobium congolense]SDK72954.1 DNA-binding transcriptional regulator, ArsR family [Halanaerobium congolense]SDL85185.1 DNA-binding transcriptional regulator, ArsR family [Halanaerobium congolense]
MMNGDLKQKDEEQRLTELADLAKGLSHPHRLKIVKILAELPAKNQCMVSSIVDQLPIAQSTVSQHLKILKETGWIEGRIDGSRVCYCIKEDVFAIYTKELEQLFKL